MLVVDGENIVAIDVDQTLFMHGTAPQYEESFTIINPYSGSPIFGYKNWKHIELLKQYKGRGLKVIVWSSGGNLWAEAIVRKFDLVPYVDIVMNKPNKLIDDLEPQDIFPCRIYLPE